MRLTPEQYVDRCWDNVQTYVEGINDGSIVVGEYIHKVLALYSKMLNDKEKYTYRKERVEKVFAFFSFLNAPLNDKYLQFPLLPWQCFVLSFVFGFYRTKNPEKRVIREVFLFMARKNGKTAFSAALQLYGMLGENVINPQSILIANTATQASVALNFAKDLVYHSLPLKERLIPYRSRIIFRDHSKQGFCQVFSSQDPARLEGHSPSLALIDEIHGYDDNAPVQAIRTGTGARQNPLICIISTAGSKNGGFCNEYLSYHKNKLDGKIKDDTSLAFIYQPDKSDLLSDEECWAKANPSLGVIVSLDDLREAFNAAKHSFKDTFFFITKILNVFYDAPSTWIPSSELTPLNQSIDLSILLNRDCYVGMDLSRTTDLTSVSYFFPPTEKDPKFYLYVKFFIADRQENFIRKNGKDLEQWVRRGYITKSTDRVINLGQIFDEIKTSSTKFNIIDIAYDRYNAPILISQLQEEGLNCTSFSQTATKFNAPLKYMETLIYNKAITIIDNPVLLWNFENVVIYVDSNDNIKVMKNKQNDSVDGVVASAMAIGSYLSTTYGTEISSLNNAFKELL